MPRVGVTVYDLLLSCPGDVLDLMNIIDACVKSFNASIGEANNIRIELKHWSTDSFSQSGDKPQNILNKQFVDECDLCVALLGTRFGTPTDNYDSGTEEEIEKMFEQNKQVFLYFVERNVNPNEIDLKQYEKVRAFKEKYSDRGIYTVVKSPDELRTDFQNALSLYFIKLVAPHITQFQPTLAPELVIASAETDEQNIVPFHTNYRNIKLVKTKEAAIKTLIQKVSDIKIILSSEKINDEFDTIFSNDELLDMSVADIKKATEDKKISTKQYYTLMGRKPPVYEKIEIDDTQLNLISEFCERHNIVLSSDFYFLGNLQKEVKVSMITAFGNSDIAYLGSDSEQEKYKLLEELLIKIQEYNHVIDFFANIDAMPCVSLMIENIGNTYDEDIDIKLFIKKNYFADISNMPESGILFLEEAVEMEIPKILFKGNRHADIEDYSNYPQKFHIPQRIPILFQSKKQEIAEQREKYQELMEYVFCYDLRENDDEDILCFNIPYLKQHTKMFFPSYLFFIKTPENLRYEIRSKRSPEIYKGTLVIKTENVD